MNNVFVASSSAAPPPALLADLLGNLPYGVIVYEAIRDTDGQIIDYRTLFINSQALAITGYTTEEMTAQLLFQRSPYLRAQADSLRRVVDERLPFDSQERLPSNNRWFTFENRPLPNGFFTVVRDINDLKAAEQQLEQHHESLRLSAEQALRQQLLLRSVLNASPGSLTVEKAIRNEQGQIVDFQAILINQNALVMGGHSEDRVLSQPISELNPLFKPSGLLAAYQGVMETGQPFNAEFFYPPQNKHIELTATRLDDDHLIVLFDDVTRARQDAQALHEKNALLDGILRTSTSAIVVLEALRNDAGTLADFRVLLANEAAYQTFRLDASQTIGQPLTALYPNTKETGLWAYYVDVCATGQTYQGKYFESDLRKWFDVTVNKLGDGVVATFNDITLALLAGQQIEEQARLFDSVLNTITNGLSVLDVIRDEAGNLADLRYVRVSQTILADTGLSEDKMLGNTMLTLFPAVKQTAYWPAYEQVLTTGKPLRFEAYYKDERLDNYTDNWVTRIDDNRLISIYVVINDQKRVEMQVRQQAATLQSVLNSCQMPIVLFEAIRNEEGQIVDFRYLIQNEANARLVNHPIAATTQRTMLEVLPTLKSQAVFDRYVAVAETGESQRFEQFLSAGSVEGWFDISVVKQGDGIVVAANDQTLLRQTLQRAEQLVIDLRRSNADLEQFAYVASHDLQEPLRKIQSFGDVLVDQFNMALPADARDMIRRMQSAASRMSVLIRDLLTYSRLSTGQEPFRQVDVRAMLTDILTDFELTIGEKKAQISLNSSTSPLPVLMGNPVQLRQLFQNLIGNALKFSRPGLPPQIVISARTASASQVPESLHPHPQSQWTIFTVTDNGIGFDSQYQDRIFQLFERLHGRSEYAGTGIGLAVCRKVAENHGGLITARSQPGQGATFTVYLPE